MNKKTWKQKTVEMLRTKKPGTVEIAEATGLNLRFVQRLKADSVKGPAVDDVQKVHDYLRYKK